MAFARPLRRWLASWLVCSLLFTQLVTAAYACPKTVPDESPMPCAEMMAGSSAVMDKDQPGLCLQHCQPASQNVDATHAPTLTLPAIVTMFVVQGLPDPAIAASRHVEPAVASAQAPPAPHSILHCCWRI